MPTMFPPFRDSTLFRSFMPFRDSTLFRSFVPTLFSRLKNSVKFDEMNLAKSALGRYCGGDLLNRWHAKTVTAMLFPVD